MHLQARTVGSHRKIMAKKNMKPIYERYAETMEQHRQKVEELAALAEAEQYYPEIDEKARMRRDILAQKALTRSGIDPFAPQKSACTVQELSVPISESQRTVHHRMPTRPLNALSSHKLIRKVWL